MTADDSLFLRDVLAGRRRGLLPSLLRVALAPFGVLYGAAMAVRRGLYVHGWIKPVRLPGPVISIGNLTAGGTGKTPLVYWAARRLLGRNHRVAVLARGYGEEVGGETDDERVPPELSPFPVKRFNDLDRVASGNTAIREWGASCVILDDGFQHLRVARDLDIVVIDASARLGLPLPAGLLREFADAVAVADWVVITRVDQAPAEAVARLRERLARSAPRAQIAETRVRTLGVARGGVTLPLDYVRGLRVVAFCGIGSPESFERTLATVGVEVVEMVCFPDHHPYGPETLADLERRREQAGATMLLTTSKDAWRMTSPPQELGVLLVDVEFVSGEEALGEAIIHAVEQKARS